VSVPLHAETVSDSLDCDRGSPVCRARRWGTRPKRRWTMEEKRSEAERAETEGVEPEESLGREPLGEGEEG